jgi:hypothetical protein
MTTDRSAPLPRVRVRTVVIVCARLVWALFAQVVRFSRTVAESHE